MPTNRRGSRGQQVAHPTWLTADNAVHPIYDYPELLKSLGFEVAEIKYFKILGMKCHWSVRGVKKK